MNYEQKYNEMVKRVRELHESGNALTRLQMEIVCPELRESEDERIRKFLVNEVFGHIGMLDLEGDKVVNNTKNELWKKALAYLEKQKEPKDKGEISDGYHTFNELYYYRMLYNAAFFNLLPREWVHKSKRHHDGEECFGGGWFVVMANLPTGQISNHYELKDWDLFQIPEKEIADEWDGHTPQEVAKRIHEYLLEEQKEQKPQAQCVDVIKMSTLLAADRLASAEMTGRLKERKEILENPEKYGLYKPAEWSEDIIRKAIKEVGLTQHQIDWLKTNVFPSKQEWSEEDEYIINTLIHHYELINPTSSYFDKVPKERFLAWLKSLRPQQKVEWSEQNKIWFDAIIKDYEESLSGDEEHDPAIQIKINLLKSLRPQPKQDVFPSLSEKEIICLKRALDYLRKEHNRYDGEDFTNEIAVLEWLIIHPILVFDASWKPSEEQLDALKEASVSWMNEKMGNAKILESLYEQLKAL